MAGGRPTSYRADHCATVIASGKEGKTLAEMARDVGVDRMTLRTWTKDHPEFFAAVKAGLDLAQAWWEDQGRIATFGGIDGFNATSYIFQMKNRFREDWADISRTELTGKDGGAIQHEQVTNDADAFEGAIAGLAARSGTGEVAGPTEH